MKIESYEPYHIGSKILYYADKQVLISRILEYYKKKNEDFEEDKYKIRNNVVYREALLESILTILIDDIDDLIVQLNLPSNALNVIGNNPKKVHKFFNELSDFLPNVGFNLESTFSFFEVITNIVVLLEEDINPKNIFQDFINPNYSQIYKSKDLFINFVRYSTEFTPQESGERFQIEFKPHLTSPNNRIMIKILNRSKNIEDIKNFENNLEDIIKDISTKFMVK